MSLGSSVAVSRILPLRYKQSQIKVVADELPGQKVSALSAEMRLACSHDQSLMVLGKSLPLATKENCVCQKILNSCANRVIN